MRVNGSIENTLMKSLVHSAAATPVNNKHWIDHNAL